MTPAPGMSPDPIPAGFARDARWLAQALDSSTGLVRLVEMDRDSYRRASFLDDRMLQQSVKAQVRRWPDIAAALPADGRRDARWIFHIGHVGSTLIARLLGELPGVLAVREPRILRDVAALPADQREQFVPAVQTLLSRSFVPLEKALVKATSFVSEIAPELVPAGERALFLYASPRAYIATILAGENSPAELRHLAESRRRRAAERVPGLDAGGSDAQLAAAAWACEMTALEAAAETMRDRRVMWADFDALLDHVARSIGELADFFGFAATPRRARELAVGPLMRRYSKAPEYGYSPGLRQDLLEDASREHRADIDRALAMLDRAAETSPLLRRALARARMEPEPGSVPGSSFDDQQDPEPQARAAPRPSRALR